MFESAIDVVKILEIRGQRGQGRHETTRILADGTESAKYAPYQCQGFCGVLNDLAGGLGLGGQYLVGAGPWRCLLQQYQQREGIVNRQTLHLREESNMTV